MNNNNNNAPVVHNRDTLLLVRTETSSGSAVEFCVGAVTTAEVVATTLRIGPETFLRTRRWKTIQFSVKKGDTKRIDWQYVRHLHKDSLFQQLVLFSW